ncbi:MAG: signal recognition particle-docking protein FtsY [Proteobacteria bacterium]|nr:signal recognition particle-docking protein FtsY [Pseudomonadota bacterium]
MQSLIDKLTNFSRLTAENADTDVILVLIAAAFIALLLLVIGLRTTIYRNFDRKGIVAVARRVEHLEESLLVLREEMSATVEQLREITDDFKRELSLGTGSGGSGSGAPPSGGGGALGGTGSDKGGRQAAAPQAPVTQAVTTVKVEPIVRGMERSRRSFLGRLKSLFAGRAALDSSNLDDLEELLILSDVGARCAALLVASVRRSSEQSTGMSESELREILKAGVRAELIPVADDHPMYAPVISPQIVLVVGVNGVGKTTTVAKLAARYQKQGKRVMVIAADTFRAAAVQQLAEWSNRIGFQLVSGAENAKPGAVVFDGMALAKEGAVDVVLIDTAGRLHTKANLMQELEGVRNSIRKHIPDAPHQTILVLDGVSGQNALAQAREFNSAVALTGIVITKLDGTPKGGIVIAISQELKIPVLFVGVGERAEDLIRFRSEQFVEALFDDSFDVDGPTAVGLTPGLDSARLNSPASHI